MAPGEVQCVERGGSIRRDNWKWRAFIQAMWKLGAVETPRILEGYLTEYS